MSDGPQAYLIYGVLLSAGEVGDSGNELSDKIRAALGIEQPEYGGHLNWYNCEKFEAFKNDLLPPVLKISSYSYSEDDGCQYVHLKEPRIHNEGSDMGTVIDPHVLLKISIDSIQCFVDLFKSLGLDFVQPTWILVADNG